MPSYLKTRLGRGTVKRGDWRFPDHYCFCSPWKRTLTPHSIKLSDEVEEERMKFITVPGLDVFITQTYCDFLPLPSFYTLSSLFSPPSSVRNILRQILNVRRNPKVSRQRRARSVTLANWCFWLRKVGVISGFLLLLMFVSSLTVHLTDGSLMVFWSSLLSVCCC